MSFRDKFKEIDTGERRSVPTRTLATPYIVGQEDTVRMPMDLQTRYRFCVEIGIELFVTDAESLTTNTLGEAKARARAMVMREFYDVQRSLAERALDQIHYGNADDAARTLCSLLASMEYR